jgi:hypothetical protein
MAQRPRLRAKDAFTGSIWNPFSRCKCSPTTRPPRGCRLASHVPPPFGRPAVQRPPRRGQATTTGFERGPPPRDDTRAAIRPQGDCGSYSARLTPWRQGLWLPRCVRHSTATGVEAARDLHLIELQSTATNAACFASTRLGDSRARNERNGACGASPGLLQRVDAMSCGRLTRLEAKLTPARSACQQPPQNRNLLSSLRYLPEFWNVNRHRALQRKTQASSSGRLGSRISAMTVGRPT